MWRASRGQTPDLPGLESVIEIGPDEFHSRDPRSQVALPAVALGLVGGVGFIVSFIALSRTATSDFVGTAHELLSIKAVPAALTLPISVLIAAGASRDGEASVVRALPRGQYPGDVAVSLAWLLGLPAGLWALFGAEPNGRAGCISREGGPNAV